MKKLALSCLAAAFAALCVSTVQAQTVITSLPYTITAPGEYVLNANLSSTQSSGNLIEVDASNVTIDFQGHYIAGASANLANTQVIGVFAFGHSNTTIRNGTISYCYYGVRLSGNDGSANVGQSVTNMRVAHCSYCGIAADAAPSAVISGCQLSQIGATNGFGIGILVQGSGVTVQGCTVNNVTGTNSYGVFSGTGSFTRQCQVSFAAYGVYGSIYQDNLASFVDTAFSEGTDGGGNVTDGSTYSGNNAARTSSHR